MLSFMQNIIDNRSRFIVILKKNWQGFCPCRKVSQVERICSRFVCIAAGQSRGKD